MLQLGLNEVCVNKGSKGVVVRPCPPVHDDIVNPHYLSLKNEQRNISCRVQYPKAKIEEPNMLLTF